MKQKINLIIAVALTIGIFLFDIYTPLGYAEWLFYVLPLMIAAPVVHRLYIPLFPLADTIFIVSGFFLSPFGGDPMRAIANRSLGVFTLWVVAFFIDRRKQANEALRQHLLDLEKLVDDRTAELRNGKAALQTEMNDRKQAEEALRKSAALLKETQEITKVGGWELNVRTGKITWTDEVYRIYGVSKDFDPGNIPSDMSFYDPESLPLLKEAFQNALEKGEPYDLELKFINAQGRHIWVRTIGRPARDNGRVVRVSGNIMDVTDRRRMEEALRDSEERFRTVFEAGPLGIALVGMDLRFHSVNRRYCELTGYAEQELLGRAAAEITHPEDIEKDAALEERLQKGEIPSFVTETRYVRKDGSGGWGSLSVSIIRSRKGEPLYFIGMVQDITDRKKLEEEMRHMAHHDALTGLPNRRFFEDIAHIELTQARRNRKKAAILFLDLDRFKEINDALGHAIGDALLREVAGRLRRHVRESDTIARIGGDEFNILLPDLVDEEDCVLIAGKIIDSLRNPYIVEGHRFQSSASIGISIYPDDATELDTLLRYADIALYHAKDQGRNNYQFYNPVINIRSLEKTRMENSLLQSLERGELDVYYQPQLDIRTGKIASVEALVRWRHPEKGLIEPKQFLSAAEETGFITEIDKWVLRTACSQVRAWLDAGLTPVGATVNLSSRHFHDPELVKMISGTLRETGLGAEYLDVEVTETVAMSNIERTAVRLKALDEIGVHVSIDDFGSGCSSLKHLKRLPIQKLKIDQSLMRNIATNADDRAIIRAVISMAHAMKIRVLAECIETEEQIEFIRSTECDEIQGFAVGRPLPANELTELIAKDN